MSIYTINLEAERNKSFGRRVQDDAFADFVIDPDGERHVEGKVPEWGNVQFSISLPMPETAYCNGSGDPVSGELWPMPATCREGRYRGIFRMRTQATRKSDTTYRYSPMTFHMSEEGRFGADIARTLGECRSENDAETTVFTWRAPLPVHGQGTVPSASKDRLFFIPEAENDYAINGHLELLAFEIIQSKDTVCEGNSYHRFLVLHFLAIDCNSRQLEAISRSLTRTRNKLKLDGGENLEATVLFDVARFVMAQLNRGVKGTYTIRFKEAGYLDPMRRANVSNGVASEYAEPARTVCAIPNVPLEDMQVLPKIYSDAVQGAGLTQDKDTLARVWAAQLTYGLERFSPEVPSLEALKAGDNAEHSLQNWYLTAEGNGIAAIRKTPSLAQDLAIFSLTSNRFVDLLLLSQRAYAVLRNLSQQMRQITIEGSAEPIAVDAHEDLEISREQREKMKRQFKKLSNVQTQFAELRNMLWYNAIPRRPVDTHLMLRIREEMGVQNLYDDLVDEVQFRHRIHDLAYHEFDTEFREKEAELREQQLAEQEAKDKQFNALIAVVAIAVAIPSYIALLVEDSLNMLGVVLLILSLILSGIVVGIYWRRTKKGGDSKK